MPAETYPRTLRAWQMGHSRRLAPDIPRLGRDGSFLSSQRDCNSIQQSSYLPRQWNGFVFGRLTSRTRYNIEPSC